MAMSLRSGNVSTARLLRQDLGNRDLTEGQILELAEAITASGAVDAVEDLIAELSERALGALAAADLLDPGHRMLADLAHAAVDRHS